jgi:hypothetical protein
MSDAEKPKSEKDAELEREIRADRKFSLGEAIGRMAGPGMMKGVSPVTPKRQAEQAIVEYLGRNLTDSGAVLGIVLLRRVEQSGLLLNDYNQPLAVLASYVRRVLGSEYLLKDLVREADMEWGLAYGERPHFERAAVPPDPDDPYTTETVRAALTRLIDQLPAGET